MTNRFILTPYFLDKEEPNLAAVAGPDWYLNRVQLPEGSQQERMVALYRPLVDFVATVAREGNRPVSLAGDCCTSLAVLAGLQRTGISPTLIWLDAHGDFNTWETTPSGFLGGMPLAMLVGRGEQTIVEGVGLRPLPEEQVILSDARDLDPEEKEAVAAAAIKHLPAIETLLDDPLPPGPLYVHFDADLVDPGEAPAMNYPAPGGPPVETLYRLFRQLANSNQLVAVSVSAWAPDLDEAGKTQRVVMELVQVLVT